MSRTNSYACCSPLDFAKEFDVVDHVTLLEKLHKLHLPDYCMNWIKMHPYKVKKNAKISLAEHTHTLTLLLYRHFEYSPFCINHSIVHGSGIWALL